MPDLPNKPALLIESFLEMMMAERGSSSNTCQAYRRDLADFVRFSENSSINIEKVTKKDVQDFLASLTGRGISARSSARKLSTLKQFYQFLFSEQIIPDNPVITIEGPKQTKSLPKFLTEQEMARLFETVQKDLSEQGARTAALLEISYAAGLRVSELVSLKISAIQKDGTLIIKGKGGKERMVPLHRTAQEKIKNYLNIRHIFLGEGEESEWLFPSDGKHLTRQRFGQILKELAIKANLDPAKISPHILRHSFASHMLHHGADLRVLQELLGHSDISTTQVYTHILDEKLKNIVTNKHPLAKKETV